MLTVHSFLKTFLLESEYFDVRVYLNVNKTVNKSVHSGDRGIPSGTGCRSSASVGSWSQCGSF